MLNSIFIEQAVQIPGLYPELEVKGADGDLYLAGDIILKDENEAFVDSYQVKITASAQFPYRFPDMYETSGRIPINLDWHRYVPDGRCCVKVPAEEALICHKGITLLDFIELEAKPYFFNQTYREINGYFLNERAHGIGGVFQFYLSKLPTKNPFLLLSWLHFIIHSPEPPRVALCFCGSNKKYRQCHRDTLRTLRLIDKRQLLADWEAMNFFAQQNCKK